ncbi:MAG: hypothetical protein GX118_00405 [Arcobacter butzleri]|nr:hypothetical protein [Aliarcobacter butzleri]
MKKILIICIMFSNIFAMDSIKSFSSDFIQEITKHQETKVEYKGNIIIANNSHIAWFYTSPLEKSIYIIKDEVVIIEPMIEQVIYTNHHVQIDLLEILKKAYHIKKDFQEIVEATTYSIKVDKEGKIEKISYIDEFENSINIIFFNTIYNKDIDMTLFEYNIPDEYDIIYK